MNSSKKLPNQSATWGKPIEEFHDWKMRHSTIFASDAVALCLYLQEQLKQEGKGLSGLDFNNILTGLPNWLGENNNRAHELLYAYLALTVERNELPARRLVEGIRLVPGLHPDYVARTRCYENP